jgi:hypothetical protein
MYPLVDFTLWAVQVPDLWKSRAGRWTVAVAALLNIAILALIPRVGLLWALVALVLANAIISLVSCGILTAGAARILQE